MTILLFDAVKHECEGGPSFFSTAWLVSGDPAGEIRLWRYRSGDLFWVLINTTTDLLGGLDDMPTVAAPAPNYFTYKLVARNSDGVETFQDVGPIEYWGYCLK